MAARVSLRSFSTSRRDSFLRHVGIGASKIRRNRIRIANRRDAGRRQRPLQSFLVHDDSNNFWKLDTIGKGSVEFRHNIFAVRHLLHVLRRDKTHCIDMLEPGEHKLLQILGLVLGWDELRQSLPRIARAFNEFYRFSHLAVLLKLLNVLRSGRLGLRVRAEWVSTWKTSRFFAELRSQRQVKTRIR